MHFSIIPNVFSFVVISLSTTISKIIPPNSSPFCLIILREYSSYSALRRDYDEGEKADDLAERIRNELVMRSEESWENQD
jgi:hypothetical protein